MKIRTGRRTQQQTAPPVVSPFTGRVAGEPVPVIDEAADAALAAGQNALASAVPPRPRAVGFDPRRSMWAGTRP